MESNTNYTVEDEILDAETLQAIMDDPTTSPEEWAQAFGELSQLTLSVDIDCLEEFSDSYGEDGAITRAEGSVYYDEA